MCPVCHSVERHRLLWLFLHKETKIFSQKTAMLYIAPEKCFVRRLRNKLNIDYTSIDIESDLADFKINLTFNNKQFDVFYCSHVLEHIDDDKKAMSEIFMALKWNSWGIILVPIKGNKTKENLTLKDPKLREQQFEQFDHVRYYGLDIKDRLEEVGFKVKVIDYYSDLNWFKAKYFRLINELIIFCMKNNEN